MASTPARPAVAVPPLIVLSCDPTLNAWSNFTYSFRYVYLHTVLLGEFLANPYRRIGQARM